MTRWSEGVNWGSINVAGSILAVEVDLQSVYQKYESVNRPKKRKRRQVGPRPEGSGHVCHVHPREAIMPQVCIDAFVPCRLVACPCPNPVYILTLSIHLGCTSNRINVDD